MTGWSLPPVRVVLRCLLAHRYSLAAAMLQQMTFEQTQSYKQIIIEIAVSAHSDGRSSILGVIYDELMRFVTHCHLIELLCVACVWQAAHCGRGWKAGGEICN